MHSVPMWISLLEVNPVVLSTLTVVSLLSSDTESEVSSPAVLRCVSIPKVSATESFTMSDRRPPPWKGCHGSMRCSFWRSTVRPGMTDALAQSVPVNAA